MSWNLSPCTELHSANQMNVAVGHATRNNGDPCKIGFAEMDDGVGLAGGFACKSSVKDLLLLYQGLLRAKQDQAETKLNRTSGLPFMHTNTIFSPHIGVGTNAEKLSYCLGLYRTQLPGPLSVASINSGLWGPSFRLSERTRQAWKSTITQVTCQVSSRLPFWCHRRNLESLS